MAIVKKDKWNLVVTFDLEKEKMKNTNRIKSRDERKITGTESCLV